MSLKTTIQAATKKAFAITDSLRLNVTYSEAGAPTYDADTGAVNRVVTATHPIRILFAGFKSDEIDGNNVQPNDERAIIDTQAVSFVPSLHDFLTKPDGTLWEVQSAKLEPSESVYILHIRRP